MQASPKVTKVLLVGSGLMTPALVDYLVQFKDTHVTVASNILADAEAVAARHPQYLKAAFLDIFNVRMAISIKTGWEPL
jgi:saccharopine dehydrogenase-like NADP-dependent oxidoreductase